MKRNLETFVSKKEERNAVPNKNGGVYGSQDIKLKNK